MFGVNFILVGLLAIFSSQVRAATNSLSGAGIAEFSAAYEAWDEPRFATAADLFRRATVEAPTNATNFYWLGVAQFHRMLHLQNAPGPRSSEAAAQTSLDAAVDALERAAKLDERHAETHALLGTLYGMKINGSLLRAVKFGPRVAKRQELAVQHGASNPRVHYLLGMCQFHTSSKPSGWKEALETLLKAEKLFEAEAKTNIAPFEPRWGRDSCLTFIGRTYELLGQSKEAADYFRKALALHPVDNLAAEGLKRVTGKK